MVANNLGGALAAGVIAIAVLHTLASLSMPVRDRAPGLPLIVTWLLLLSVHAALYWRGERIRGRLGVAVYAIAQAVVLFSIAVTRAPTPVTVGLFMACTAEFVVQAGAMWGTVRITIGAIALFVLASLITSDLYRATTAGL